MPENVSSMLKGELKKNKSVKISMPKNKRENTQNFQTKLLEHLN